MFFFLATSDYTTLRPTATKVRVYLTNGIAEIFEQHQTLLGKIDRDRLDVETIVDNKIETTTFLLQNAIFVVSNKELTSKKTGTYIYVYAQRVKEITSSLNIEELIKQNQLKKDEFEKEKEKVSKETDQTKSTSNSTKLMMITEEIAFLERVISFTKEWKTKK